MDKKRVVLKKSKSPQLNKALVDIEDTLNDIDDKLEELRQLDKGSKVFAIIGYLLLGLGGGGMLTIAVLFANATSLASILTFFFSSFLLVLTMIGGFMLAHKGLTGDWL